MNVNSIKADTPTTNFINVSQIDEQVKTQLNNLGKVLDTLEDLIDKQVRVGGLSVYAYNKGGEAPLVKGAKTSAKTIYDDIEGLRTEISSLKKSIPNAALRHKLEEYQILKSKLTAKIKEVEDVVAQKKKALDEANANKDAAAITKATQEYNAAKEELELWNIKLKDCEDKIKKYS